MLKQRLKPFLDSLQARQTTNRAVAKELGVSEEHLSRTLKAMNFQKDPPVDHQKQKDLLRARKALRETAANTLTIKQAARAANCSERTIYRFRK